MNRISHCDPLGRRLAKIISAKTQYGWEETDREYYLFDGKREIGAFIALNRFKNFRVLSPHQLPKTLGNLPPNALIPT